MDLVTLLYSLGLSANYAGFHCIIAAVEIAALEPRALTMVTKWLYPQTAKQCKMNWKSVERNIRSAIDLIWEKNPHKLQQLTGCPVPSKPTAAHFIAILAHSSQPAGSQQGRPQSTVPMGD